MHAIAGMFYARASLTPKRVLRSLRAQKVLTTVRQIARATPGAPRTARPSKCAISQSQHEPKAACPCTQPQKCSAHVIWSRPKTRPGIFSQSSGVRNGTVNKNSAGRATDCPPIKMHHLERYTRPEWPARTSHNRRSAPHAFGPRKRPGNSLHSKCARNGTSNSGRNPRARHRPTAPQNAQS